MWRDPRAVVDAMARLAARLVPTPVMEAGSRLLARLSPWFRSYRLSRILAVTRNVAGREQLAREASRGRYGYPQLAELAVAYSQQGSQGEAAAEMRRLRPSATGFLAWALFVQDRLPDDPAVALGLYEWLWARRGMGRHDAQTYAELLLALGRREDARAPLPPPHECSTPERFLWADITNPFTEGDGAAAEGDWLEHLNAPYRAAALAPLALASVGQTPYDRLGAEAAPASADGPRVTVVVSAFRPDHRLLTAVRSVTASTWKNLEVLVVDDASGPGFDRVYEKVAAMDPRVSVHRMPVNGGTYRIRNFALDAAAGELITFHDSDDWMHPQRVELQARHLQANPGLLANTSRSVRVTEHLELSHGRSLEPKVCEPSLMLRRKAVVERVGYFDSIRKGGDAEFRRRLEHATRTPTAVIVSAPLTLQLITRESLSGSEIRRMWMHLDRRVHRSSYELWHRRERRGGLLLPRDVTDEQRPFCAPRRLTGGAPPPAWDVVYATDWLASQSWSRAQRGRRDLTRALAATGARTAIAHLEDAWSDSEMRISLSPTRMKVLNSRDVGYLNLADGEHAATLIVDAVLPLPPECLGHFSIRAGRVLAVVDDTLPEELPQALAALSAATGTEAEPVRRGDILARLL